MKNNNKNGVEGSVAADKLREQRNDDPAEIHASDLSGSRYDVVVPAVTSTDGNSAEAQPDTSTFSGPEQFDLARADTTHAQAASDRTNEGPANIAGQASQGNSAQLNASEGVSGVDTSSSDVPPFAVANSDAQGPDATHRNSNSGETDLPASTSSPQSAPQSAQMHAADISDHSADQSGAVAPNNPESSEGGSQLRGVSAETAIEANAEVGTGQQTSPVSEVAAGPQVTPASPVQPTPPAEPNVQPDQSPQSEAPATAVNENDSGAAASPEQSDTSAGDTNTTSSPAVSDSSGDDVLRGGSGRRPSPRWVR